MIDEYVKIVDWFGRFGNNVLSYRFLTHSNDIKVNLTEIPEEYNFVESWANKKEQIDKLMEFIKGGCE